MLIHKKIQFFLCYNNIIVFCYIIQKYRKKCSIANMTPVKLH